LERKLKEEEKKNKAIQTRLELVSGEKETFKVKYENL